MWMHLVIDQIVYVTRTAKMSVNVHGLIMSSLSPRLTMLQTVIKHLKSSLFVCFLRGAAASQVVGLLLQSTAFQLYEY